MSRFTQVLRSMPASAELPGSGRHLRTRAVRVKVIAAFTGAALLAGLTACGQGLGPRLQIPITSTGDAAEQKAEPSPSADAEKIPKGFRSYYKQKVTWAGCDDEFECATISAPMDWTDPDGESIDLAIERKKATGQRIGSLLINPGGPGSPGTDFVQWAPSIFGSSVLSSYDIVGFDPRGVGRSSAISCQDDTAWDHTISTSFPMTEAGLSESIEASEVFSRACEAGTGPLIKSVETESAARDLDLLRAVLGDKQLHYLGFSYGTLLGSTYAALFPGNVGRMVLDGAVDPSLDGITQALQQAEGFETALRAYVVDCQNGEGCPLGSNTDAGMAMIRELLDRLSVTPMSTSDKARPLTSKLASTGIVYPLYARSQWPVLTSALTQAINQDDGSGLLTNADAYNSRNEDGTFDGNAGQAFIAISCSDPNLAVTAEQIEARLAEFKAAAPTMYTAFVRDLSCSGWPTPAPSNLDFRAPGASPIVVVGTTGDPATPYSSAVALAKILESGVLLTYDGEGHTAYGASNDCLNRAVDRYLVHGIVPEDGTVC